MQQAVMDWKRNELFVLDYKPHVKVYDLSGNYKRTLPVPIKVRDREMYPYSDSHLVLFKEVPDTVHKTSIRKKLGIEEGADIVEAVKEF